MKINKTEPFRQINPKDAKVSAKTQKEDNILRQNKPNKVVKKDARIKTDRIEISTRMNESESIKDSAKSVSVSDKTSINTKRLEELKQRISRNEYYVSTEKIIDKILK